MAKILTATSKATSTSRISRFIAARSKSKADLDGERCKSDAQYFSVLQHITSISLSDHFGLSSDSWSAAI